MGGRPLTLNTVRKLRGGVQQGEEVKGGSQKIKSYRERRWLELRTVYVGINLLLRAIPTTTAIHSIACCNESSKKKIKSNSSRAGYKDVFYVLL
jgi:hypothetical protein